MPLLENLFSHGAVERLGWMLVHFLWQAVAVALLLAALLRLLGRASANLRYVVACGALALMVATPLVTIQFIDIPGPVAEVGPLPEIPMPAAMLIPTTVQMVEELPPLPATPPLEEADLAATIPWRQRLATTLEPTLPYVVLGWLAGVLGLSAWHLGGWTQLQRLKRRMVRETGDALHATLDELATRLGVRRVVTLLESAFVEVPTVVGWLRPTILLPASALTGLSSDQLRAILAHELAHIRRYDYLANIVQTVVEILGFYHPAVWWVSHQIRIERENCCDDLAVRVCDNSLQYARALASMEEIRHSQSELAMAASGGSLMARIARLLGRPAVDDRRFTWLPGLIALLLVVGVVIPTAFALTRETPHGSESEANATSVSVAENQDAADSGESDQAQIQVSLVLAELYADTVLDPQTAEEVAGLLARILAHDGKSIAAPSIDELRRPLADVLSTFTPAPGRAKEFVDLLSRKKDCVARTLSAPRVTVLSGETLSFTTGDIVTPEEPLPEDSEFTFVCCVMTAIHVPDQNAIRMDIDMFRMYPVNKPSDPNGQTGTWTLKATVLAANNQWMTIADKLLRRLDCNGRECIQLPLVLATIVDEPEAVGIDAAGPMMTSTDDAIHLPPGMGALRPTISAGSTQILMNFYVFPKISPDKAVDRETRHRIAGILATENVLIPGIDPQQNATLGEVLQIWIAGRPMSPKTMELLIDTLQSRGYLEGEGRLEAMAGNNQQARMIVRGEELSLPSADPALPPQTVRLGTCIQVTPHLSSLPNDPIMLDITAQWREQAPKDKPGNLPVVYTTEMVSTLTIPHGQCQALVATNAGDPDAGMQMLLVGPPAIPPAVIAAPQPSVPTPDEPARTQVLLAFTVLDVMTDRVLDPDTAVQARHCVVRIPPADGGTASASTAPLLVEELLLPLRDVFARYAPIPEKSKDLTDLLISRGYATILSKPRILTFADEPASISLGEPDDPNAANGYMRLNVNTHVLEDRDATRLEIDYSDRSAIGDSNDPNRPVSSTQIASTLMVPNNEYAALVGMNAGTPRANMRILLIGPIKVIRPQPAARQSPATDTRAIVKSSPPSNMDRREELSVPIDLVIAKVRTKAVPDRKTLIQIAGILAERNPQINEEIADADTRHGMTLGDILKKYVAGGKLLTPAMAQALLALLQSQGYVQLEAKPSLVAKPREQSEVRLTSYIEDPAQPLHYRELGTTVRVTAHLPAATDDLIRLKIAAEVNEPVPPTQSNNHLGVRHSQIVTEVIVPEDRYVSLLVEASGEMPTDANDPKATLVLLKARIDKPGSTPTDDSGAQAEKQSHQPQRVILNARVVEIDSRDLLNLGVAWGSPPLRTGQGPPDSDLFKDMQIGFTADRITTDSLMTKLRQLHTANRVHVMADPQFVSENGHPVQLLSFSEVWVNYADEQVAQEVSRGREECKKLFAGASLLVTPLVDDDNEITLEVEAETSKSHPQNGGASDLPIVTRRRTRSKLAIQDGGTVALAGLVGNPSGRNGPSAKTIVVFATASIIPETGPLSSPRPTISQKMQTQTRPEMTETRHLRLKHRTLQQVMDLLPSEYQEYIRVEDTGISDPDQSGRFLTVTAPASITDEIVRTIRRLDVPRQVLLDVHVVEIDRGNMAKLGIEWNRSTASVGGSDNTSWPKSIQIGHASNSTSTDSLMRILDQLESTHQARTITDQQIPIQDGSHTQLRPIQEEWCMTSDDYFDMIVTGAKLDRIRTWAIVSIVTRVADSNEITLEMAVSVDENSPNGATIDLPLDRLPQNRSPVTIQNGGTVILAGFPTSPTKRNRRSAKEIAIFLTAYLIPQTSETPQKINGA